MAIAPCAVLPYITADPRESCYIIHVNKNSGRATGQPENGEKTVNANVNSPPLGFGPAFVGRVGHDPDGHIGGHWLLFVLRHGEVDIFDSLGESNFATYGQEVQNLIKTHRYTLINSNKLSGDNCASYCLLFAYYKCRGYDSSLIVNILKRGSNDVRKMCHEVFNYTPAYSNSLE